jgi:hypothetical protein
LTETDVRLEGFGGTAKVAADPLMSVSLTENCCNSCGNEASQIVPALEPSQRRSKFAENVTGDDAASSLSGTWKCRLTKLNGPATKKR